jgi:hypothetical protein
VSFFIWGAVFAVHFLAYLPRMLRSLGAAWGSIRRPAVPGRGWRGLLLAGSLAAGLAIALSLMGTITGWHAGPAG